MADIDIIAGYPLVALASPTIAGVIAWVLWKIWIPRSLVDLQVAFRTDEHEFEVHSVTRTIDEHGSAPFSTSCRWSASSS